MAKKNINIFLNSLFIIYSLLILIFCNNHRKYDVKNSVRYSKKVRTFWTSMTLLHSQVVILVKVI